MRESRKRAASGRRSEIASRSRFLRGSIAPDVHTHTRTHRQRPPWQIGSAPDDDDDDNVESWVNFLSTDAGTRVHGVICRVRERCLTISDRSTTRCRCRVPRLSPRMMDVRGRPNAPQSSGVCEKVAAVFPAIFPQPRRLTDGSCRLLLVRPIGSWNLPVEVPRPSALWSLRNNGAGSVREVNVKQA